MQCLDDILCGEKGLVHGE